MSTFFICKVVGDLGGCGLGLAAAGGASGGASAECGGCGAAPLLGNDTLVMASGDAMLITSWS